MTAPRFIPGTPGAILLICDHASNAVPPDIDLGIAPDMLDKHIAIDLGSAALTEALAEALDAPAILASASRLVIDLNRPVDSAGLIPLVSDGHPIPGNADVDRADRIARLYVPYHEAIASAIAVQRPMLLAAIHSFTPQLESVGAPVRPWEIGILSNNDRRAAEIALSLLTAQGLVTGDNEPYSGRLLNATLDRHGEANGIASLSIEIRNDLIADAGGVARWAMILAPILAEIRNRLASTGGLAT
ncbi:MULTISPECIES: N-formylglutamate amidohydrolase [Sphingomonas]|jgi:predicted N-formylglutamate amidohydrolase|uniref:N-formylglutamate amidohydrolase n=2 Tax=Pseudomonadota TaxID=1224 RepID=UPI001AE70EDC